MKTIQFILFLVFISGSSILMINSGRISPQIEQQHNSYWTVIANAQSEPASGFDIPEPASGYNIPEPVSTFEAPESEHFSPSAGSIPTRSTGYHLRSGRESNTNRNLTAGNRNLTAGNKSSAHSSSLNPLHNRIIQTTLQPMDLIISPEEAKNYAATLNTKMQYITKR